eukprot:20818_1
MANMLALLQMISWLVSFFIMETAFIFNGINAENSDCNTIKHQQQQLDDIMVSLLTQQQQITQLIPTINNNLNSVQLLTGTYSSDMTLPLPDGFTEDQCSFFWASHENYYGGNTGDVVPSFGNTREARLPYSGQKGWKGGAWIVIGDKPININIETTSLPIESKTIFITDCDAMIEQQKQQISDIVTILQTHQQNIDELSQANNDANIIQVLTGTYSSDMTLPLPDGFSEEECSFFWGSHENYYGGNTGDIVPLFGNTRQARLAYSGQKGWKGGAWIVVGVKKSDIISSEEEVLFDPITSTNMGEMIEKIMGLLQNQQQQINELILSINGNLNSVAVLTGKYDSNIVLPLPVGYTDDLCSFFWGSHE